jgi:hypothetical protein
MEMGEVGFEPLGFDSAAAALDAGGFATAPVGRGPGWPESQNRQERFWTHAVRPEGEGQDGPSQSLQFWSYRLWWLAFASSRRLVTNPVRPGREQR